MCRLKVNIVDWICKLLICTILLLTGCVTSSGSVRYNMITEYDPQGNIIKTTEMWDGQSHTSASGDAGLKASQKDIDFGIQTPNNVQVHLKAGSSIEGMQSQLYKDMMSIMTGIPNDEKAAALQALSGILTNP